MCVMKLSTEPLMELEGIGRTRMTRAKVSPMRSRKRSSHPGSIIRISSITKNLKFHCSRNCPALRALCPCHPVGKKLSYFLLSNENVPSRRCPQERPPAPRQLAPCVSCPKGGLPPPVAQEEDAAVQSLPGRSHKLTMIFTHCAALPPCRLLLSPALCRRVFASLPVASCQEAMRPERHRQGRIDYAVRKPPTTTNLLFPAAAGPA